MSDRSLRPSFLLYDGGMMQALYSLLDDYNQASGPAVKQVEAQIWDRYGCMRAVLVLDMSGFSRTVRRFGIVHYLAMVRRMQMVTRPLVEDAGGTLVKFEADNLFAVFHDVDTALRVARAIRAAFAESNIFTSDDRDIHVSMGLAWGRILLVPDHDFFGDAVNVACKLGEDLAAANEILLADEARTQLTADPGCALQEVEFSISGLALRAWQVMD